MTGRTLSHYTIEEKLGEGGMGVVYKARDTRLNRFVALKVLPADKVADAERKRRFVQEAQAASALNHPNIITIHDINQADGVDFIAMEYVEGKTLDRMIPRNGMRLGEVLKYAIQIAAALARAHAAGIIHRDIKPANVMITPDDHVKVLDFGLAKLTEVMEENTQVPTAIMKDADAPRTGEGAILGTVAYMSPEQATGKKVDARSDIFSFGSVLYEMATGHRAFQDETKISTLAAVLHKEPPPVHDVAADTPRDLEKIIARCLRKDPTRRFQHMDDIKVALEELKEESESGKLDAGVQAPTVRHSRVNYAVLASVLAFLVAALFLWRSRNPSTAHTGLSLHQLTQDTGRTADPAISPDGKLVAYASDRAGDAGMDIWVQQLTAEAQPIRLTRSKGDELEPSFSPDGGRVVFSSDREGGGIYVMPALGGEERLLLRGLYHRPRFSPDGQWIAAWAPSNFQSRIVVVPVSGGAPRPIAQDFYVATTPVWSPDSAKILFTGQRQYGKPLDWWVAPLDGGPAVKTGADAILGKLAVGAFFVFTDEWLDGQVLFSASNLWRVPFSRDFRIGTPERLTVSTALESTPRAISGPKGWRIVFVSGQVSQSLWSLPLDLNAAKPLGEPAKLFADALRRTTPSLSGDGSRLVYVSRGPDGYAVRLRDMKTGVETTVAQAADDMRARISPDGGTIAYTPSVNEAEKVIYLASTTGGDVRKFCETCGLIYDWTPDGKKIVYRSGNPMRFWTIEVATNRQTEIVAHPKYGVYGVVPSPDQRWMAIHYGGVGAPQGLFIAPAGENGVAKPRDEWITVAERPGLNPRPWWSPDGRVIYYLSAAGRQINIWARHLDPNTKQPRGEAFVVYSPPAQRNLVGGHPFGPAVGAHQLIFMISESTGNIWLAE